ncbi:hypothetical protein XENOCAPTIV_015363 [Xenoophorus captivus]|uniref:Secreted protein n=1 Tax=Xenoophorus captivus TaxID=1517983 RepID=A0ABV0S330_9TELE
MQCKNRGRSSVCLGLLGALIPPAAAALRALRSEHAAATGPLFFRTGSNWPVALRIRFVVSQCCSCRSSIRITGGPQGEAARHLYPVAAELMQLHLQRIRAADESPAGVYL